MDATPKPAFLFADSQLLFWRQEDEFVLDRVKEHLPAKDPKAAYVGASNGDQPEFYELFVGAMQGIDVESCRMIPAKPSKDDFHFLDHADLILLAGGDVERGWRVFEDNGLEETLPECYYKGAVLVGISAGAIQLGLNGIRTSANGGGLELFSTFKLLPFLIDVHSEPEWTLLSEAMPQVSEYVQGLGIPSGGGAIVHPDMTVEPLRRALVEMARKGREVRQSMIFPDSGDAKGTEDPPPDPDAAEVVSS